MGEVAGEGDAADPSLACPLLSSVRKRCRDESDSLVGYHRPLLSHVRVQIAWDDATTSLLSLRGQVLDAQGQFNAAEFPGLAFFYSPVVVCVACGTATLMLGDPRAATERLARETRHRPCPLHGPFRCPCHVMHEVADGVAQLLREVFCQHVPFDVSIDYHCPHPHLHIDSVARTWSLSLVGLPLPPLLVGSFPLGAAASPPSIKTRWLEYRERSRVVEDACVVCGTAAAVTHCSRCLCQLCQRCGEHCDGCGSYVCRGCCAVSECSSTTCYNCSH
ncbi:hypothetical protein NESM_000249500 [Novymonas esmeraldas]|uniref:Uncharacterized protein n=1 Tax=Novymonas esmeraldas TaxID=1808958 RepID=A0AAW0F6G3_9TRYP